MRILHSGTESQITNPDLAAVRVDKHVIALYISVDNGRFLFMQILQAFENSTRPRLDHLETRMFNAFQVSSERAACHQLCNKHDLFSFSHHPRRDEVNDVVVFQILD